MPTLKTLPSLPALLAVCLILAGCGGSTEPQSVQDTYTVRGKVVSLPVEGNPTSSLQIHHEPIPSFRDGSGVEIGMNAMSMPFPPAEGLSLEGLSVGDIVSFDFQVARVPEEDRLIGWELTSITALPADTELDFGDADGSHDHVGHDHH